MAKLGWGKGLGGQPFPVFKNFYSGGLGSVRGFDQGTLGPRDVTGASHGRPQESHPECRTHCAVPGAGNDRTLRCLPLSMWATCTAKRKSLRFSQLRASVGVGLSWISPVGSAAPWRTPTPCASSRAIESRNCNSRLERLSNEVPFPSTRPGSDGDSAVGAAAPAQAETSRRASSIPTVIFREAKHGQGRASQAGAGILAPREGNQRPGQHLKTRPRSSSARRPRCRTASARRASASWWTRTANSSASAASSRKT
jgi:hypothetical protein